MTSSQDRVLIVEDDALTLNILAGGLGAQGFDVFKADSLSQSLIEIQKSLPEIILSDFELGDGTASDLLAWLRSRDIRIPVVVLTAHNETDIAVEAVKNGADSFIPKPVDFGYLGVKLRSSIESFRNLQKTLAQRLERARYERDPFLGNSQTIQELRMASARVSKANGSVLIQGETGVGKGVLARWLHKVGPRSNQAFVELNCAGLSRDLLESEIFGHQKGAFTGAVMNKVGFLEAADHGTLFLDEIGDMDLQVQAKILKVVEEQRFYRLGDVHERRVDVQIVAATHRDLKKMCDEGGFRSDLFFRINALRLRIPPLRERLEDIPIVTDKLLEQFSWDMKRGSLRITDHARLELQLYSWPGNIRELRNVLERASLLSDDGVIHKTGLEFETPVRPDFAARVAATNFTLHELEKQYIQLVLESEGGHIALAAKRLGMPRSSLYAKLHEHGLLSGSH